MTRINTNVGSLIAQKQLARSNSALQTSLTRLSTGLRINTGKDDPAGLIASEVLRADIISVQKAITNSERANQLIATADSALGQVSALLNDIRGLVSEAANAGALSTEQIEANQLQVDASLESIDRIARVTSFQGKRLLDGSLDFITTPIGTIDGNAEATLGAASSFSETQVSAGAANSDIVITATSAGSSANYSVRFVDGSAGTAGNESASLTGTQLTITIASGVSTANQVIDAINALTEVSAANAGASTGSGTYTSYTDLGNVAQSLISGGANDTDILISALSAGTAYNDITVRYVDGSAGTAGNESASLTGTELTITIASGVSTANQVIAAINALSEFSAAAVSGGTGTVVTTTDAGAVASANFSGGAANTDFAVFQADGLAGTAANVTLRFTDAGGGNASLTVSGTELEIFYNSGTTTVDDIVSAINASGGSDVSAAVIGTSGGTFASGYVAAITNGADPSASFAFLSSGGVDASGILQALLSGGSAGNLIELTAVNAGPGFNNVTIEYASGGTAGSEAVTYDATRKTLTITIDESASTTSNIVSAINSHGVFSAALGTGTASGATVALSATANTSGGFSENRLADLRIDQANFGTASAIQINVQVDRAATQARLDYSGGTLLTDLTLEIGGSNGFEVFNLGAGSTIGQIAEAVNLVSDATGVSATTSNGVLVFTSVEYGQDEFVSVRALVGQFSTIDVEGSSATRAAGTDVQARVNGVSATGNGRRVELNTSGLDLSFYVSDRLSSGSSVAFTITGGGAVFQLGPEVVSNQQARLGIKGISTATLGGVSGTLFELRSGGTKSLTTNPTAAAAVVSEVITQITQLRGRLGSFQKTTLETNIFTLNDTLGNLTEAESTIRDADFAEESARLTRAQILVQSGISVLSIANSNPQNVLQLLR